MDSHDEIHEIPERFFEYEQTVLTLGHGQSAALGHGVQNVFLNGRPSSPREPRVSIAPPLGRRSLDLPLRGRQELLTQLEQCLEARNTARVVVVNGLAGSGKTSLALEIAYRHIEAGVLTWWISGNEAGLLEAGMLTIATSIGVTDIELMQIDPADALWRSLKSLNQKWLLIVDNANDPTVLSSPSGAFSDGTGWVRPDTGKNGRVLLTSQLATQSAWGSWCVLRQTAMLDDDDGAQMLLDYVPDSVGTRHDARSLSSRLGGLPLAIRLAGLYLAETSQNPWPEAGSITTFKAYLEAMNEGSIPDKEARDTFARSWNLSLELLDQRALRFSRPLLHLLSLFADAKLPFRKVLNPDILRDRGGFEGITGRELWRTIRALMDLGMADPVPSQNVESLASLRVHPLVQHITRIDQSPPVALTYNLETAAELAYRARRQSSERSSVDSESIGFEELMPHIRELAAIATSVDSTTLTVKRLVGASCTVLNGLLAGGLQRNAENVARSAYSLAYEKLGDDHAITMHSLQDLARVLAEQDKYVESEAAYVKMMRIAGRTLGKESVRYLGLRHEYADRLAARGEGAKAVQLLREVIKSGTGLWGENSERVLTAKHCLADALREVNQPQEAKDIYEEVLAVRVETHGEDHELTMRTRHDYAHALMRLGLDDDSEQLHREVLDHQILILGPQHRSSLNTRHCLSHLLAVKGELAAATSELRVALEGRTTLYGETHPATLELRRCLASLLGRQANATAARHELTAVLELFNSTLGVEHSKTLRTRHELAHALSNEGDSIGAQKEFARLYALQKRVLGAKHNDTRDTKWCLEKERRKASSRPGAFPLHGGRGSSKRRKSKS